MDKGWHEKNKQQTMRCDFKMKYHIEMMKQVFNDFSHNTENNHSKPQ